MCSFRRAGLLICTSAVLANCSDNVAVRETPVITLDTIGLSATAGFEDTGNALALFTSVLDAAVSPDGFVTLDAQPPFVRVFDGAGALKSTVVNNGEGPGEARRPLSLASLPDGFLVTEPNAVHEFSESGDFLGLIRPQQFMARGAVSACGGIVIFGSAAGAEEPGVLLRYQVGEDPDTMLEVGPIRYNYQRIHPFFAEGGLDGVFLYTEEIAHPQLLQVDCEGSVAQRIPLDSLGPPQTWNQEPDGTLSLHPAAPPFPSGFARIGREVVWASRVIEPGSAGMDSLTVIMLIPPEGDRREVKVRGWLILHDTDGQTVVASRVDPVPHVVTFDGTRLLEFMEQHGRPVPTDRE